VIPLIDRIKVNKLEFMTKGKLDNDKLRNKLMEVKRRKIKK
jgi:hypothetical protein